MKIYALMSGDLILYVGKTTQLLGLRAAHHRCHKSNNTSSKNIPKDYEWEIVLLDEVPDAEGRKWERHYYDTLDPLYNERVPGRTGKEWYAQHKEEQAIIGKIYREKNADKISERMRKWYETKKSRAT
jgi:hypothetical protein